MNDHLVHPGFILFEGLDMSGKSSIAQNLAGRINNTIQVDAVYSANKGFLLKDPILEKDLRGLSSLEKSDFVLDVYSKEKMPLGIENFREIIQDRYFPSILFYSQSRAGQNLLNDPRLNSCLKPKYIFLVESSYNSKKKRSRERTKFEILENKILFSERDHNSYQEDYRRIIEGLGIPYKIINTTNSDQFQNSRECLDDILKNRILTHLVNVTEVMVDFEPRVYPSTAKMKNKKMLAGVDFPPLNVERRYDLSGNSVDIIVDGRHRAHAALASGYIQYPAYIRHKKVDKIDFSHLTKVKDFGFK